MYPPPSICTDSISSFGIAPIEYCRIQKMPKAGAAAGTIKGKSVPIQCRSALITNKATTEPADGSKTVPIKTANKVFLKGNSNFAKVKPASEEENSTRMVTTQVTRSVLKQARKKS